jgi:hypothetical protein
MILRTKINFPERNNKRSIQCRKKVFCEVVKEISEYQAIYLNFRFQRGIEGSVVGYRVILSKKDNSFPRFGLELQSEFLENLATYGSTWSLLIILRF